VQSTQQTAYIAVGGTQLQGDLKEMKITTRSCKSVVKHDQVLGPDSAPSPPETAAHRPSIHSGRPEQREHTGEAQKQMGGLPYSLRFRRGDGSSHRQVAGEKLPNGTEKLQPPLPRKHHHGHPAQQRMGEPQRRELRWPDEAQTRAAMQPNCCFCVEYYI
jgi:hypothetical protein